MLTPCIIAKNEAKLILRLLASLTPFERVILLDTGSTDKTVEVARSFPNVEVEFAPWTGNFGDARILSTASVTTPWFMWLDADMWFEPGEVEKIMAFLPNVPADIDGISLNVIDGQASFPSPRICRHGIRFQGAVHENPFVTRSVQTPFRVMHEREEDRDNKDNKYREILLDELKTNPESLHALMYLRDYAFNAKAYDECEVFCHRMLRLEADYLCHYYLGCIAYDRKQPKEAVQHALRALECCPTDPRVYTLLGDSYDELGQKVFALTWYEHAFRLPPEAHIMGSKYAISKDDFDVVPRTNQAKVYVDLGKVGQALALYEHALQAHPETHHRKAIEQSKHVLTRPQLPHSTTGCTTSSQRLCAAFTTSRADPWLWAWLSHYSRELGEENLWVLYEPNDPMSLEDKERFPRAHFVGIPNPFTSMETDVPGRCQDTPYDKRKETWRVDLVHDWQEKLLKDYQSVIFGDCDELLVPPTGILPYVEKWFLPSGADYVRTLSWQPVHQLDSEPAMVRESGKHILADRKVMFRSHIHDKTLLVRKPQRYCLGYHFILDEKGQFKHDVPDSNLPMIHLWRNDFDTYYALRGRQWGVSLEDAKAYFRDHRARWRDDRSMHAIGPAQEVPQVLKDILVLR